YRRPRPAAGGADRPGQPPRRAAAAEPTVVAVDGPQLRLALPPGRRAGGSGLRVPVGGSPSLGVGRSVARGAEGAAGRPRAVGAGASWWSGRIVGLSTTGAWCAVTRPRGRTTKASISWRPA